MTNYREILRLNSLGLNKNQIAKACMCSRTTVIQVLRQAVASGIQYPLPDGMSDKELTEKLYPPLDEKPVFKMPDYKYVHKELQKKRCHTHSAMRQPQNRRHHARTKRGHAE